MENNYTERVNELKSALIQAKTRKEDRERELQNLKVEYENLVTKIQETYNCKPKELKSLIDDKTTKIDDLLTQAENTLNEVKQNLGE